MDIDAQLQVALQEALRFKKPIAIEPAMVVAVDGKSVDVITVNGVELFDVRLGASDSAEDYNEPMANTWVLIAPLQGTAQYVVIATDKPKIKNIYAQDKLRIATEHESLAKVLADLVGTIEKLNVSTPAGPSSVPNNLQDFVEIKNRISKFLNE